jgi:hypothetical protein
MSAAIERGAETAVNALNTVTRLFQILQTRLMPKVRAHLHKK